MNFWVVYGTFTGLYGLVRDKYTESGTAGQIVRKRDCPAESGTVGMYADLSFITLAIQEI